MAETATYPIKILAAGPYSPGSFILPTERYLVMCRRLNITGSQTVTIQGTATLRIM